MLARMMALGVASGLAACVTTSATEEAPAKPQVKATNVLQADATSPLAFREMVRVAWSKGGMRALDRLVAWYPDLALAGAGEGGPGSAEVAASYDRVHAGGEAAPRRAVQQALAAGGESPLLAAARSAAAARAGHAALVAMLAAGVKDAARFGEAVLLAGGARDPGAWEQMLDLRPPAAAWPAGAAFSSEAALREQIVVWRLDRNETECAVIAAVRAEAMVEGDARRRVRVQRARALGLAGRRGEALLLLSHMDQANSPALRAEALALAGSLHGQLNDLPAAVACLTDAAATPVDWRGRGRALSDLGVVLLRSRDEERGLAALHEAQRCCEQVDDRDGLVRALRNEVAFVRSKGEVDQALQLEQRAAGIAQEAGLLTDPRAR